METVSSPHRMLRLRQVLDRVGLSRATIYNRIAAGTFPKAINLGGQSVGWLESEVIDWLEARIAASPGGKDRLHRSYREVPSARDRPMVDRTIVATAPQRDAAERERSAADDSRRHKEKLDVLLAALRDYLIVLRVDPAE